MTDDDVKKTTPPPSWRKPDSTKHYGLYGQPLGEGVRCHRGSVTRALPETDINPVSL